ncbi:hypothetical protein DSO57_1036645 [Entomophthora muscae]|uniref:Uncharacterized protein n=1 Tax=Entomophthora muscae TaxID=34485 RepID=A0ACC2S1A2_9FUNG|nr:hypothetical protein DSO57_1036645 [Entomophthora muscae]
MGHTFVKTKPEKISAVYNKLCEFTEAFAGQRLHPMVYLGYLFYFGMGTNVEDLDRVLLGFKRPGSLWMGRRSPWIQLRDYLAKWESSQIQETFNEID